MLATIVWAALASAFAGYYYLQNGNNAQQLNNAQNSVNKLASNYSAVTNKYDLLLGEYGSLYGTYYDDTQNATFSNYTSLMPALGSLIADFGKNYTNLFVQTDINETYHQLLNDYENRMQKGNLTEDNLGSLLSEYYTLFSVSALRELGLAVSKASTLSVNIAIDYGNRTTEWFNETKVPAGYSLFELTQEIATVKYSYYNTGPGHVWVDSINGIKNGASYWLWYYWNNSDKSWAFGPVGCDAWLLQNAGVYEWKYES
jgi:uncharacterized protein YutD